MKYFASALILFIFSCSNSEYDDSVIKQKVLTMTSDYNKVWETLNVDKIAEFHSNENFVYYWHGEVASTNNDHFREIFPEILSTIKEWSMKKTSQPLVQVI